MRVIARHFPIWIAGVMLAASALRDGMPSPDGRLIWWHEQWRLPIQGGVNTPTLVNRFAGPAWGNVAHPGYTLYVVDGALGGNCLIVWVTCQSGTTITIADDKTNTWTTGPTETDTTNTTMATMFFALNVVAGTRKIDLSFSPNATFGQASVAQFYNIATSSANDESGGAFNGHAHTTGTTWSTGAMTTLTDGSLLYYAGNEDTGVATTAFTAGGQGSGFALSCAQPTEPDGGGAATQYQVWASHGAITPAMTVNAAGAYIALAVALKAATAGTAPATGIRVVGIQFCHQKSTTASPWTFPFPCTGNLLVLVASIGQNRITAVATTPSNTWTQHPNSPLDSGNAGVIGQYWYAKQAATASTLTFSCTMTTAVTGASITLYDVIGAADSPLDLTASATGNQTVGGNLATVTITPSGPNELVIMVGDQNTTTAIGAVGTGYLFDVPTWPGQDEGGAGGGAGDTFTLDAQAAHFYTTGGASLTFTYTLSAATAAGQWEALAIAFLAPPTGLLEQEGFLWRNDDGQEMAPVT